MRLFGKRRTRDIARRYALALMGVQDIQLLTELDCEALVSLDNIGKASGLTLEQRRIGLHNSASALIKRNRDDS